MKQLLLILLSAIPFLNLPAFAQTPNPAASQNQGDSTSLGLPGDNLDLYAVLDLFQKSKTIEEFEKTLNLEETGINNLDLNLDKKVDFIKVITKKDGENYSFILQVDVSKDEKQDVAVIIISKDANKKTSMQIIGDKDLYGKDYIVELKETVTPSSTPNPGYTGANPDTVTIPAKTTVVVVESAPIVQYVYSPVYVPYAPPYYYGYYPPYYTAFAVVSISMYWGHHAHYHSHYGYHGNTVVIHNHNTYNNYNNTRNTSNTVNHNRQSGGYNNGNSAATRPSTGTRPSTQPATRPSAGTTPSAGTRPSTQPSTRPSTGTQPSTRPSSGTQPSTRPSSGTQPSTRPSSGTQPSTRPSSGTSSTRPSNTNVSPNRSSGNRQTPSRSGGGGRRR